MIRHTLFTIISLLFFFQCTLNAQENSYSVKCSNLNVRSGPSTSSESLGTINGGEIVNVLSQENPSWWLIQFNELEGYVSAKYLSPLSIDEQYRDWDKVVVATGDKPDCENISPSYDYEINNKLIVHVGINTDAVIKLMDKSSNECIRIAYVRGGDTYHIRNIPEGVYFLKIAYGRDFRKYTKDDQCIVKFVRNAIYEIGKEEMDFNIIRKPNTIEDGREYVNWDVPYFELFLDVKYSKGHNSFKTNRISEEEFNK